MNLSGGLGFRQSGSVRFAPDAPHLYDQPSTPFEGIDFPIGYALTIAVSIGIGLVVVFSTRKFFAPKLQSKR